MIKRLDKVWIVIQDDLKIKKKKYHAKYLINFRYELNLRNTNNFRHR